MAAMKEIICKCGCGRKKMVRVADIKRGWGKFYSKSCKAKFQCRTKPFKRSKYEIADGEWDYEAEYNDSIHPFSDEAFGPF